MDDHLRCKAGFKAIARAITDQITRTVQSVSLPSIPHSPGSDGRCAFLSPSTSQHVPSGSVRQFRRDLHSRDEEGAAPQIGLDMKKAMAALFMRDSVLAVSVPLP